MPPKVFKWLFKCPSKDAWLEWVSTPQSISLLKKFYFRTKLTICSHCQETEASVKKLWMQFSEPEPDLTDSLIRVFHKLQKDETLVLKGWKLNEPPLKKRAPVIPLRWVGVATAATMLFVSAWWLQSQQPVHKPIASRAFTTFPKAQIRRQENNTVKVHYIQPELVETLEFETDSNRR